MEKEVTDKFFKINVMKHFQYKKINAVVANGKLLRRKELDKLLEEAKAKLELNETKSAKFLFYE